MKYVLERTVEPDIEPVSLSDFRLHVREYDNVTVNDPIFTSLIKAARGWAEEETGRAMIDQTWVMSIAGPIAYTNLFTGDLVRGIFLPSRYGFCEISRDGAITLPRSPVISVTSVKSVDSNNVETTVDPTTYALVERLSRWPRLIPLGGASWQPSFLSGGLRITFRAGYADRVSSPQQGAEMVPERFKQAIKLWAEANYDRDEKTMQKYIDIAAELIKPLSANNQLA